MSNTLDYATPPAADPENAAERDTTFLYFGALSLWVLMTTPIGYLVDIQTAFLLKNQLKAAPDEVATFRLLIALPVYFAFVFGLIRDTWSPLGMRDRGYFLLFAPLTAAAYVVLGCARPTYPLLFGATLMAMLTSRFLAAAYQGLIALIGQEKRMSGRLSALWQIINAAPNVAGGIGSGFLSSHLSPRAGFLIVAGLTMMIAAQALWKPRAVFSHAYDRPQAKRSNFVGDVRRLLKHRAIYPAVLICFLWNFAPGFNTPLQYYLTDKLRAPDSYYSYFNAIFSASFVPTLFLFGYLCKRFPLRGILWWGTLFAIPQLVPLAFIHSGRQALLLAAPIGLMGGVASGAYFDLAMRSCPPGLQGTLMMLVDGVFALSARGGDVIGTQIYQLSPTHGFFYCVIATTAVYALILPLILLVPKPLIATADGEAARAEGDS